MLPICTFSHEMFMKEVKVILVVTFNDEFNGDLSFKSELVRQGQIIFLIGNLLFRLRQQINGKFYVQ